MMTKEFTVGGGRMICSLLVLLFSDVVLIVRKICATLDLSFKAFRVCPLNVAYVVYEIVERSNLSRVNGGLRACRQMPSSVCVFSSQMWHTLFSNETVKYEYYIIV